MLIVKYLLFIRYPVHHSVKVNKWLAGDNIKMSVFDSWPATSGDLLPIDAVFADILKEFQAKQVRVHSEKDLYKEVEKYFLTLTTKENYVNSLTNSISIKTNCFQKRSVFVMINLF